MSDELRPPATRDVVEGDYLGPEEYVELDHRGRDSFILESTPSGYDDYLDRIPLFNLFMRDARDFNRGNRFARSYDVRGRDRR